jgi:hypothetical protein
VLFLGTRNRRKVGARINTDRFYDVGPFWSWMSEKGSDPRVLRKWNGEKSSGQRSGTVRKTSGILRKLIGATRGMVRKLCHDSKFDFRVKVVFNKSLTPLAFLSVPL